MNEPVVILGGGGHARVVLDVLHCLGRVVAGVIVPDREPGTDWHGVPVLGDDRWLTSTAAAGCAYAIGIGAVPGRMAPRHAMYVRLTQLGLTVPALVHPAAVVSQAVALAPGVQVMAGAIVQPGVRLGANALLNTGARVDHDSVIGEGAHVAPGAILCGD
ncbi:MAG: PglD-related sugar-binding protein, partial [Tepidimonas sp.]|uniref:PglD-related sugar-binding protein n=1 Tax=Tepidimonas sp. TaxID=2002775 RepID=UPI0040553304